ncbi:MAG: helix-turn-helix transcriptional regulator [Clostridiales bacterium]|nr:helix-turn-helix transcriptional regulator [Clostridiales bacterium]
MTRFRERLKELRIEKNVTQQELGNIISMSKMAISHWEKGHSEPSISQLISLATYFDVSVDYLVGKTDIV